MSPLLFLGGAALLVVLVVAVAFFFQRERHTTFDGAIEKFQREMRVLAPDQDRDDREPRPHEPRR